MIASFRHQQADVLKGGTTADDDLAALRSIVEHLGRAQTPAQVIDVALTSIRESFPWADTSFRPITAAARTGAAIAPGGGFTPGVYFPVVVNGQVTGAIDFCTWERSALTGSHAALLETVGDLIGQALTRLEQEALTRAEQEALTRAEQEA